jgi:3-oxoacyl-[acyl-carrier-protein] synthase-3
LGFQTPYFSKISGTGSYLPEKKLTNHDLEKMVETSNDWILERTGIYSRSIAAPGEATSDLCVQAGKRALEAAGLTPQDLDGILVATVSPDQPMPNTACVVQEKLGARQVFSLDISAACSGFVYGLSVADALIRMGAYKHILVVGGEVLHQLIENLPACSASGIAQLDRFGHEGGPGLQP